MKPLKRVKVDASRERRILIALVVSKQFLSQAAPVLDLSLVDTPHFKQVAQWCLDYYREYDKAPGKHIEDIYLKWSEDNENKDLVESVREFLESLSTQHDDDPKGKDLNIDFLVDELADFLNKRKIKRMLEDAQYSLLHGKTADASRSVTEFKTVQVGQTADIRVMTDLQCWKEPFASKAKPIINLAGAAGRFFNPAMTRDALIAIQATEKSGKSMWCIEFMMQALRGRRRVAMFQVGDLSRSQIMARIGVRWANRPMSKEQCRGIDVPISVEEDDEKECGYALRTERRKYDGPMDEASVVNGIERFKRSFGMRKDSNYLMLSVHHTKTINVAGINGILSRWVTELGWEADCIIIDYADILAPETGAKFEQDRNYINETWAALRRLSQERHALVIVPTQANAMSYSRTVDAGPTLQTMRNFSEDKRKLAHVTGMFALNQTPEEKDMGGMRLNWIVLREAPYSMTRPLIVGTCFALGRALCCARY